MIIQPNWTVTDQGPWQLIYNDVSIISLSEANGITSTQGKVFVGTKEECEAEKVRLNLPWASDIQIQLTYKLVYSGSDIVFFGPNNDNGVYEGTEFLGSQEECEAEIFRFGLSWPSFPIE